MTASEFLRALLADRASSRPASANDGSGGGGGGDARIRVRRQVRNKRGNYVAK